MISSDALSFDFIVYFSHSYIYNYIDNNNVMCFEEILFMTDMITYILLFVAVVLIVNFVMRFIKR